MGRGRMSRRSTVPGPPSVGRVQLRLGRTNGRGQKTGRGVYQALPSAGTGHSLVRAEGGALGPPTAGTLPRTKKSLTVPQLVA